MAYGKRGCGTLLLMMGLLTLWGCAAGGRSPTATDGLPIGTRIVLPAEALALGDVACDFYKAGGGQSLEQFEIRCPGWERAAGQVWRGNLPRPATQWQERFLREGDLAKTVQADAACGDLEPTGVLNNQPAKARSSKLWRRHPYTLDS